MISVAAGERVSSFSVQSSVFECLLNAIDPLEPLRPKYFQDVDWEQLIASADHHGVLPLVADRLLSAGLPSADSVLNILRSSRELATRRGLRLANEVLRVSDHLRQNGIRVVPYKGPVLAEELWGDSSLRECSDLDFLVPVQQVDQTGELLEQLEYSRVTPIAKHLRRALLQNSSEEQFRRRDGQILLELQWAPAPSVFAMTFNQASFWSRTRQIPFAGGSVLSPSAEDLLQILCVHGWKHNWSRLIWLGDIAQLLNRFELDWSRIRSESNGIHQVKVIALALHLCNRCFRTKMPSGFAIPNRVAQLGEELLRNLQMDVTPTYLQWHRYMLAARDSRLNQVRQMARFLFTPGLGEYGSIDLPSWAAPAYRLVRIARVLRMLPDKTHEQ